jgi:dihydrofolate reductase
MTKVTCDIAISVESALAQAREAAGDGDVAIGGGAQTVRQ